MTSREKNEEASSSATFNGWKEIAAYLSVDKTTAQRYAKERGLPVRRLPGGRGRVVAYGEEIDAWRKSGSSVSPQDESQRPAGNEIGLETVVAEGRREALEQRSEQHEAASRRRFLQGALVGAGGLAAVGVITAAVPRLWRSSRQQATAVRVEGPTLVVMGNDGLELWRHTFPGELNEPSYNNSNVWRSADIDGDGHVEVLFTRIPRDTSSARPLICFNADGEIRWEFIPGRIVEDRLDRQFAPPFWVNSFEVVRSPGTKGAQVVVSSHHNWSFPDQVAVLDGASGKLLGEYWHRGHLYNMVIADLEGNGHPSVLLGGVNDAPEYKQATLLVFDPRRIAGGTRDPSGSGYFKRMPPGTERKTVFLPRTEIGRLEEFNRVVEIRVRPGRITAIVSESTAGTGPGSVIYEFDFSFRVLNVTLSDGLVNQYLAAQSRGALPRESADTITERLRKSVVVT